MYIYNDLANICHKSNLSMTGIFITNPRVKKVN